MNDSILNILINAKDQASAVLKGLSGAIDNAQRSSGNLASQGLAQMNKGFEATAGLIKTGLLVGLAGAGAGLVYLTKTAVENASMLEKQGVVLDIISSKFGINGKAAKELAVTLGRDLRVGTVSASESLQYLIRTGLTLDQSSDLLKRFTNEAITGKSSSIDLATAVKNLAFAYTTGNSALGNMSGVSENFNDIDKRGLAIMQQKGELLGLTVGKLDEAQKMQARYAGMIDLTNLTLGSSAQLQGTLDDNMMALGQRFNEFSTELGNRINPYLKEFTALLLTIDFSTIQATMEPAIQFLRDNAVVLQSVFIGLAGVIGILVVGALFSMATAAIIAAAPFILLGTVIGLLFYAWQTNFGGIRQVTQDSFQWIGARFGEFGAFLLNNLSGIIDGIFRFVNGAVAGFNALSNFLATNFAPIFGEVFNFLAVTMGSVLQVGGLVFGGLIEFVGGFLSWISPAVTAVLQVVLTTFGGIFAGIMKVVLGATKFIQGIFTLDWRKMLEGLIDMVAGLVGGIASIMDGVQSVVQKAVASIIGMIMSIGENEWVKKGLDILGLGGAMDQLAKVKAEMEKPVTANRDSVANIASGAKSFLGIAQTPENTKSVDDITNLINVAIQGIATGMQSLNFKDIANQIKGGGDSIKKFLDGIGKSGQEQLLALAKNPPALAKLGDEQKGAFKEVLANLANASGAFGKQVADIKTSEVAMPNLMLEANKDVEKAKADLETAKIEVAKSKAGAGGGASGGGAAKETQTEKDLKVLKAQLDIMKDQASQDIEKLQKQKELSQFEEAKTKLTESKLASDDTQGRSDREASQKQTDLSQLEIDRQIQLRKDKLDNDTRAINQKISSITINVQTLPNQSNEDIAQQVARIIGQQINQTA